MRHTFQITVDYTPDAANLATLRDSIIPGESEHQTRKAFAKRLVMAAIGLSPELVAITGTHEHTHAHAYGRAEHTHSHDNEHRAVNTSHAHQRNAGPICKVCGRAAEIERLGVHECLDGIAGIADN